MAAVAEQIELPSPPSPSIRRAVNACPGEPTVEFVRGPSGLICAIRGPKDAVARAHAEIEFRALQFGLVIASTPANVQPDYRIVERATKRWGECQWCGVELPDYIGGTCNLCGAALRQALRAAGRFS